MIEDTIVEEIRQYRQEHAAKYDYDLKKYVKLCGRNIYALVESLLVVGLV